MFIGGWASLMSLCDSYKQIAECKNIADFNKLPVEGVDIVKFWSTDPSSLSIPLRSPEEMLLARQLALAIQPENSFDKRCRGRWQRYWLRCCLKDECNYFFAVFKECGIKREDDVVNIMKGSYLWEIINSDEGKNFYKRTVADWFLKRYHRKNAEAILNTMEKSKLSVLDKIKLYYPRLLGTILIGFLPLIAGQETWDLPHKLGYELIIPIIFAFFAVSTLYLTYECYKIIDDKKEASKRAFRVGIWGLGVSFIFSMIICATLGENSVAKEYAENYWNFSANMPFLRNVLFFAPSALLIGIFIQVIWEEKTITEPL
jgi:hypothetical protein